MGIECPVCGYDPNPPIVKLSDADLRHQRVLNSFAKNMSNGWWIAQPEYVCTKLREWEGITPRTILDVGCGDGRWVPGILKAWPDAKYVGIDKIKEHIDDNKERMPDLTWIHSEIKDYSVDDAFDLVILGGTLQEKGFIVPIASIIEPVKKLNPNYIVLLMDENTPWESDKLSLPEYILYGKFYLPKDLQGPFQKSVVLEYRK